MGREDVKMHPFRVRKHLLNRFYSYRKLKMSISLMMAIIIALNLRESHNWLVPLWEQEDRYGANPRSLGCLCIFDELELMDRFWWEWNLSSKKKGRKRRSRYNNERVELLLSAHLLALPIFETSFSVWWPLFLAGRKWKSCIDFVIESWKKCL